MKTPGSLNIVAPRTRNSIAKRVWPAPALPQTRLARPDGKPPQVISSKPGIPVGSLRRPSSGRGRLRLITTLLQADQYSGAKLCLGNKGQIRGRNLYHNCVR